MERLEKHAGTSTQLSQTGCYDEVNWGHLLLRGGNKYSSKNEMIATTEYPLSALPQNVANVLAPCFVIDTDMAKLYA